MHTGFAGNADTTACAASRTDRSMIEPEERTGWRMHAGSSAAAFGSAGAEVGTETTTALRFGWGV